jgi:peptidoglycan hydrolase-like protein with peptidoglycan-binding domain
MASLLAFLRKPWLDWGVIVVVVGIFVVVGIWIATYLWPATWTIAAYVWPAHDSEGIINLLILSLFFFLIMEVIVGAFLTQEPGFITWAIFGLLVSLLPLVLVALTNWQPGKNERPSPEPTTSSTVSPEPTTSSTVSPEPTTSSTVSPEPTTSQIKQAQERLRGAHLYHGAIDGCVGPHTQQALKQFQQSHKLDEQTMSSLASATSQIMQAQERLQGANLYRSPIDGCIGPHTRQALKQFQQSHGLKVTTQLDEQTMSSLISATTGASSIPSRDGGNPPTQTSTAGLSFFKILTTEELLAVAFTLSGASGINALTASSPSRSFRFRKIVVGSITVFSAFTTVTLYLVFKSHTHHVSEVFVGHLEAMLFFLTVILAAASEIVAKQ